MYAWTYPEYWHYFPILNLFSYDDQDRKFSKHFVSAAHRNDTDSMEAFIGTYDPKIVDYRGNSPLHFCAYVGASHAIKYCLDKGYPSAVRNDRGNSPLTLAVKGKYCESQRDDWLMLASEFEHTVEILLDHGAFAIEEDKFVDDSLKYCSALGSRDILQSLVKCLRIDGVMMQDIARLLMKVDCPLYNVIYTQDKPLVWTILTRRNSRINDSDENGFTPLHVAIELNDLKLICYLIRKGANVDCIMRGFTVLLWASTQNISCRRLYHRMLLLLLKKGCAADINYARKKDGKTALHKVMKRGSLRTITKFYEYGADIETLDKKQRNMLHKAAKNFDPEVLQSLLLESGLCIEQRSDIGQTPLHLAAKKANYACVELLLRHGANVNVVDYNGYTPLRLLVETSPHIDNARYKSVRNQRKTLQALLDYNANMEPTEYLESMLEVAAGTGLEFVLVQYMAIREQIHQPINLIDLQYLFENPDLSELLEICRIELRKLRMKKVFKNVSYFDVITSGIDTLTNYARFSSFVESFKASQKYRRRKFGIYYKILSANFHRVLQTLQDSSLF